MKMRMMFYARLNDLLALLMLTLALLYMFFGGAPAYAADMVKKAAASAFGDGYPTTKCGMYYGVDTQGMTGEVNNAAIGTQTTQGSIGLIVGYTCPVGAQAFWFVDGLFNVANLNGSANGFAATGPAVFEQRFGFGSPIGNLLSMLPGASVLNGLAVPSLLPLPAGVTAGATNPYLFVGLHEADIGAQIGLVSNREWLVSYGFGIGAKTRFSNGVVGDVFAEYDLRSSGMAFGPAGKVSLGNVVRLTGALEF